MSSARPGTGPQVVSSPTSSATFQALKDRCMRENAASGKLYEDPDFKAEAQSIYYSKKPSKLIEWKRPREICSAPQFVVDGLTRFDLDQGELDNCWFIAAAATLATKPELLLKVVPQGQSFSSPQYAGIFNFFFWRYGEWKEVIIDDRLPVKFGKLIFCRNNDQPTEFWSALLEKAYAKLNGSYESLQAGKIQDALVDFTGGVGEVMSLQERPADQLFQLMVDIEKMNTLMGASISVPGLESGRPVGEYGLLNRHAYCITGITRVQRGTQRVRLIRLLNPWGKVEWTGPWSENSSEWNEVADSVKAELGVVRQEDGEFWMAFDDWRRNFAEVQLCHLTTSSLNRKNWFELCQHGAWKNGINAGGCGEPPDSDSVWTNPQYCVTIPPETQHAAGRAPAAGGGKPSNQPTPPNLIVSLMQKYRRELQTQNKVVNESMNLNIGYRVFQIKDNRAVCINATFIPSIAAPIGDNVQRYAMLREVSHDYVVAPGTYCIIPTTQFRGEEADFLLRVLTPQQAMLSMLESALTPQSFKVASSLPPLMRGISANDRLEVSASNSFQTSSPPTLTLTQSDQNHVDGSTDDKLYEIYQSKCATSTSGEMSVSNLHASLNAVSEIGRLGPYKLVFSKAEARQLYTYGNYQFEQQPMKFDTFQNLVSSLCRWITTFERFDKDQSETVTYSDLWKIFLALGHKLDNKPRQAIMTSYGDHEAGVHVTEFISCFVKVLTAEEFSEKRRTKDGKCKLSLAELFQLTLMT